MSDLTIKQPAFGPDMGLADIMGDGLQYAPKVAALIRSKSSTSQLPRHSGTSLAAGDVLGTNFTVTGATEHASNPIRLTIGTHGLTVGQWYPATIASVGGNTNANGNHMMLVYDSTKVDLYAADKETPILSNGTYTTGGTVACMHYFQNILNATGGRGQIVKLRMAIETNALFSSSLTLFLYKSQITATLDDAVKSQLFANNSARLGYLTFFPRPYFPGSSDIVQVLESPAFEITSDTADLFGELVTDAAITLQASKRIFIELVAEQRQ
jgi:hypothetical protein